MLAKTALPFFQFHKLEINDEGKMLNNNKNKFMVLDSQAIEHLELLKVNIGSSKALAATLFDYIDHC